MPKIDASEFALWIDSSHATVGESKPISLFHGTKSKTAFDSFDFSKAKDGAHWFTPLESHAESFGPAREYFLALKNPMFISEDDLEAAWDRTHPSGEQGDDYLLPRDFVSEFVDLAKAAGHDSLIIRDMGDRDIECDMYLPFTADQILLASDCPVEGIRQDLEREIPGHLVVRPTTTAC